MFRSRVRGVYSLLGGSLWFFGWGCKGNFRIDYRLLMIDYSNGSLGCARNDKSGFFRGTVRLRAEKGIAVLIRV